MVNMGFYYTAEFNSFISESYKTDGTYTDETWPEDAVLCTDDEVAMYHGTIAPTDKQLGAVDRRPVWVDTPPPTREQLISLAEQQKNQLRKAADSEIAWLQDAVDAGIATDEETALLAGWKKYRVLLMRVDMTKAPDIEWPPLPAA